MERLLGHGPIVRETGTYTWYPSDGYAIVDFVMGLVLGAWVPLM